MEMEEKMALMKLLLFLTVTVHLSSAASNRLRRLQFHYTENTDGETAEALLDEEQFVYYEKSKEIVIPKTKWMKKIENEDGKHWDDLTNELKNGLHCARELVGTAVSSSNRNEGNHTVQLMYGCKLDKGMKSGYWKFGKYFLSLNLKDGAWTAENNESGPIKQKMEKEGNEQKGFLQNECILWLQRYMDCKSNNKADVKDPPTHSMQYILTAVTPGINFPEYTEVGMVDGEEFVYYDSNIGKVIPRTEWIKKIDVDMADYWNRETQRNQANQETFKVNVQTLMQRFNQTKGVHTVQVMYGCELDGDGTKRGYRQDGYDGKDFLSLDLNTGTWTAPVSQAVPTKHSWDADVGFTKGMKNYLLNTCIDWLNKYVGYRRDTERKVPPKVDLFQEDSSSPVVCHATGFFPKAVMISWQKNGEDLHGDQDLRETTPNEDGTFQKRSILTISPKELDSDEYTCVIQHSSLEKEMVLKVSDRRVLSGVPVGVIIGAVVAVLLLIVIGCAGVFIWKKKTGFKPVSQNPSEADSSSNNSSK